MAIAVDHATEIPTTVEELPLASITPAPDNPRKHLDGVDELAASMSELGLLNPLVVTPRQGKFMVVCGHRRHAAAKTAGLATVPVIVRELDEPQRIKAMLIENCQRSDLSPLEEARGYKQLVDLGFTQRQIAGDVGKSQSHIAKRTALLELPEKVQTKIDSGGITLADANELAKLKDHPQRVEQVAKELAKPYSYGDASYHVRRQLDELEREQNIQNLRARAEKKGWRIVETARDKTYWFTPPKGILRLGTGYEELPLDLKQHQKEPCHAVGIETKTGEFVHLCTDRKRHPKVKTYAEKIQGERSPRLSADEKRRRDQRQALEDAKNERDEYVRKLLAKKHPLPRLDALRLFVASLIDGLDGYEYAQQAAAWLGVFPPVDLSETTVARAGALHVVVAENENKDGATIVTAACGFKGLGAGIKRPGDRDKEPNPGDLCSHCLSHISDADFTDYQDTLRQLLPTATEQTLIRIGAAVALAWNEAGAGWHGPEPGYLRFLQTRGYTLTPAEQTYLDEEA